MNFGDLKVPSIPISVSAVYGVVEGLRNGNTDLVASALGTIGIGLLIGFVLFFYMHSSRKRHDRFYRENRQGEGYKKKSFWRRG